MITLTDIPSFPPHVSDADLVFGNSRYLLRFEELPETYRRGTAPGCKIASAIFNLGWAESAGVLAQHYEDTSIDLKSPPLDYESAPPWLLASDYPARCCMQRRASPRSRGYLFRFRRAEASVIIVSWSAYSSPASKSPRIPGGLMPKLLTQRGSLVPKSGRLHVGIRSPSWDEMINLHFFYENANLCGPYKDIGVRC